MPEEPSISSQPVVAIGASAGGLAAVKTFLDHVPADTGLAFVVVVHLSPQHESHLAELLQAHSRLAVRQVVETTALEPNCVYVIPPNANLSAIDTHLRLSKLEERTLERAPIDHFLRTLAKTHDGNAVAVILTGTGSDGALGIKDIKANGGLVVAQDPNEAEYDGMPQSAISTGMVDYILPVAEMPGAILGYARTQPRIVEPAEGEERALIQKVFAQLRALTDRDFSRYKLSTVLRRITRRMQLLHIEDLSEYIDRLRDRPEEVRALSDDLLITVTHFFRDPEVFEKLAKEILPSIVEKKDSNEVIRVWSVGCATGEEAYSLAMLLVEQAARRVAAPPMIQVFASDLHIHSLERAREGLYSGDIATDIGEERLKRFFVTESGGYRVRKELRDLVVFAPHNILSDPPFSRLDLISCRNLLIYLDRDVQRDVIQLFHYALNCDGVLLLGSAESVDTTELFRVEDKKLCLFRKRNVPAREPRLPVFPVTHAKLGGGVRPKTAGGEPVVYANVHRQMLEAYAPPSILIGPDNQLTHLSENAGRYLLHPGGEPTASVLKLVRPELRIELQASLQTARERKIAFDSRAIPVRFNGKARPVVLHIRPALEPERDGFVLVIFEEREPTRENQEPSAGPPQAGSGVERVRDLEGELLVARERLQSIIEENESGREEMKASSEEMQSTNEELRSTMEQLETSKEELQSINEELQTVNQQNRHRVEELTQLSSDLQNLLSATDIATLFLDRDLRILRFTPKLGELFNVRITDRGRPISDLTHRLGYPNLRQDAEAVLRSLAPIEREVQDETGRWYLTRVLPYRSAEDRIDGIVLTFVDIDIRKKAEEALRASEERLRRMVNVDAVGVMVFDDSGTLIDSNDAFLSMSGYSREQVAARKLTWREMTPPEYVEISEQQLAKLAATGHIGPYEKEHIRSDGSRAWMLFVGAGLGDGSVIEYGIDVSDRKRAEALAREALTYAESVVQTLHEPLLILTADLVVKLANPAFYRYFKVQPEETLGRRIYDLGNGQWDIPTLRMLLEEVLPENSVIDEYEVAYAFQSIGRRVMLLNARKVDHLRLILLGLRDITERKRLEENLREKVRKSTEALDTSQAALQELSGRLMGAHEEERRKIARELHDDFAQRTAVIDMSLAQVVSLVPSPKGVEALTSARRQLADLTADLRQVSHGLHPSILGDLGLMSALNQLVHEFNDSGGTAHFIRSRRNPPLTPEQSTLLYRIAQEALRNSRKHAPGSVVRVVLASVDGRLRLCIEDSGPGFDLAQKRDKPGLGLVSMQERARLLGGNLVVKTKPGAGACISVCIRTARSKMLSDR